MKSGLLLATGCVAWVVARLHALEVTPEEGALSSFGRDEAEIVVTDDALAVAFLRAEARPIFLTWKDLATLKQRDVLLLCGDRIFVVQREGNAPPEGALRGFVIDEPTEPIEDTGYTRTRYRKR